MRFRWRVRKAGRPDAGRPLPSPVPGRQRQAQLRSSACLTAAVLCILSLGWHWYPQTLISGYATIIDGDTLEVDSNRVRLQGIDAPEWNQTCKTSKGRVYRCGEASARELKGLVRLRKVQCRRSGTDRYLRFLGTCWAQPILWGSKRDLSAAMVASGHAIVYRHFRGTGLAELLDKQDRASRLKLGMWQGSFQDPGIWRKQQASA